MLIDLAMKALLHESIHQLSRDSSVFDNNLSPRSHGVFCITCSQICGTCVEGHFELSSSMSSKDVQ